jgi:hypothetical protein
MREHRFREVAMSSFALTAVAGISSGAFDGAFTITASQTGEATVQFGDGLHGAAPPPGSCSVPQATHAAGGGASGNAAGATPQPREDPPLLRSGYGEVGFGAVGHHFSGILMQQGRVQIDADYNEATAVDSRRGLDEVSVAFERGQMRRPFAVAPLWSPVDKPPTNVGPAGLEPAGLRSVPSHLDSISEMRETESLRLQMAMDRLSKMMSTLSNLLQRIETTSAAVTQNIK